MGRLHPESAGKGLETNVATLHRQSLLSRIHRDRYLLLLLLPGFVYFVIFAYAPMGGILIAFQDFKAFKGIWGSPWAGFKHFGEFFTSPYFYRVVKNTFLLNFYLIVFGFPAPIVLALMLNEFRHRVLKRSIQTISYLPHFISTVVIVGMVLNFLSPTSGIINKIIVAVGGRPIYFLAEPQWFRVVYVGIDIWKGIGWGSIIYLAALAGIDPELYDAAKVDGASRWQRIIHINIPGISSTIIILFILRMGSILRLGFEQVYLLYNPAIYRTADVIATFVYRRGLSGEGGPPDYSFGTAVGLFESIIGLFFLLSANWLSKKLAKQSLW